MERRVAQGRLTDSRTGADALPWPMRRVSLVVGIGFVVTALALFMLRQPQTYYNHFVWQADAFLHGRAEIDYPVPPGKDTQGNELFQDVLPVPGPNGEEPGRGLIPFPPLPAIVLLPFVAIWGLATDQHFVGAVLGAIDVGLAWWMLGRLPIAFRTRVLATTFFAFGTVFWYTAQLGTTWYFAHIVAVGLTFVAIGLAISADPRSVQDATTEEADEPHDPRRRFDSRLATLRSPLSVEPRQFAAGVALGLAATARLPVLLGAPFLALVGAGGSVVRRGWSAALGAALPVAALVVYNLVSTGHLVQPVYDYLYRLEALGYPELNYNPAWELEDPRYIPQNLGIAVFSLPVLFPDVEPRAIGAQPLCVEPDARRGLLDASCPIALPRDTGMSVLFSSPAYLLAIPVLIRAYTRARLVTGAGIAVLFIAVFNLMHFSQGWVQIGYRFANDFAPFALPLVALGIDGARGPIGRRATLVLIGASVAVSAWSVMLQHALGW